MVLREASGRIRRSLGLSQVVEVLVGLSLRRAVLVVRVAVVVTLVERVVLQQLFKDLMVVME